MNLKLLIVIMFFLFSIILMQTLNRKYYKYTYISMILISICFNFSIRTNYVQNIGLEDVFVYVPAPLIMMFWVYFAELVFIKKTYKNNSIYIDTIIIIAIILTLLVSIMSGKIVNYFKYWNMVFLYITIFLIGAIYKRIGKYDYNKVMNLFVNVAIFNGGLGILQYITNKKMIIGAFNDNIYYRQGGELVKRVVGIAGSNNAGGNLGAILFSIVFFCYLKNKSKKNTIALILTTIFSILTLTRIGYLAIVVEIVIYFVLSNWNSVKKILSKISVALAGLIVVCVILRLWLDKIYYILFEQRGDTANSRNVQFEFIFKNIIEGDIFWSGIGAGQYKHYASNVLGYKDIDIHSQYLNLLCENGWIICFMFLIFNIYLYIKAIKRCDERLQKAFVTALFIGNLICVNFNPNQDYLVNNCLYYLAIYCFVYKDKKQKETDKEVLKM